MSEINRIDEHWKDNLIGCTFNKKLESAMLKRHGFEIGIERAENRAKTLRGQLAKLDGQPLEKYADPLLQALESVSESAAVIVTQPKTNKILDVGFNCANDLILDNFGVFLAGVIKPIGYGDNRLMSLSDISNTARSYYSWFANSALPSSGAPYVWNACYQTSSNFTNGSAFQFGSGSTAAARTNYCIQTALGTAPENTRFSAAYGQYAGGSVVFSGAVAAGGSGTVNEMGWFQRLIDLSTSPYWYDFMMFHDILGAGVGYVAGNILNGSYAITL